MKKMLKSIAAVASIAMVAAALVVPTSANANQLILERCTNYGLIRAYVSNAVPGTGGFGMAIQSTGTGTMPAAGFSAALTLEKRADGRVTVDDDGADIGLSITSSGNATNNQATIALEENGILEAGQMFAILRMAPEGFNATAVPGRATTPPGWTVLVRDCTADDCCDGDGDTTTTTATTVTVPPSDTTTPPTASSPPTDTTTTVSGTTVSTVSGTTASPASTTTGDESTNPTTGVAVSLVPVLLAAAAAVVVAKKRK